MKIAVVAHCHYIDLAEKIFRKLSDAPVKFDIFVTTSEDTIAEAIAFKADTMINFDSCQVVVGPNRGRNFAQFLVEFRNELSRYDLICHVHTKKSLHRNNILVGWGDYLIENTIGTPEIWASTIDLFENNPDCGLAYPETYGPLPFWSEHWLGNYEIAQHWAQQYGLRFPSGFVHYPVGGMFWVRPAAIAQLLEHDWSYNDFPPETAQLDGTIHHAVERLIGASSTSNGFKHYIYIPRLREYQRLSDRHYKCDPNFSAHSISQHISAAQCVSFDLFSLSECSKKENESIVLNKMSQILYAERSLEFGPLYIARRQLAELQSRSDHRYAGNISLDEIAKVLAKEINIHDLRTLKREADLAVDCLKLDTRMGQIYKSASSAGKKIALVAECAYDQAWMERVLKKMDLPSADYYFTTSQTSGLCTDSSIWTAILLETGCSDWGILHFGKDIHSDYLLPHNKKIRAIHVPHHSTAPIPPVQLGIRTLK